jgi:hypothetical protein
MPEMRKDESVWEMGSNNKHSFIWTTKYYSKNDLNTDKSVFIVGCVDEKIFQ